MPSGIANSMPSMPSKIGGDLPWSQLNENEKTERTHDIVRTLLYKIQELERQIIETSRNFRAHTHDRDGDTVISRKLNRGLAIEEPYYSPTTPPQGSTHGALPSVLSNDPDAYF